MQDAVVLDLRRDELFRTSRGENAAQRGDVAFRAAGGEEDLLRLCVQRLCAGAARILDRLSRALAGAVEA